METYDDGQFIRCSACHAVVGNSNATELSSPRHGEWCKGDGSGEALMQALDKGPVILHEGGKGS